MKHINPLFNITKANTTGREVSWGMVREAACVNQQKMDGIDCWLNT